MRCKRYILFVVISSLLLPVHGFAAENSATKEGVKTANPLAGILSPDADGGDKAAPLFIRSDSLEVNTQERQFIYKGNVKAERGDVVLTADTMIGTYDENNDLETVVCKKDVVITRSNGMRATSERAFYDVKKSIVELTESPELINKGNALTADKVTIYLNEDRSEAEGAVRVRVIQEQTEAADAVPELQDLQ